MCGKVATADLEFYSILLKLLLFSPPLRWTLCGGWEGKLSQPFCAVLCTTVVHNDTHIQAILTVNCWCRFSMEWHPYP